VDPDQALPPVPGTPGPSAPASSSSLSSSHNSPPQRAQSRAAPPKNPSSRIGQGTAPPTVSRSLGFQMDECPHLAPNIHPQQMACTTLPRAVADWGRLQKSRNPIKEKIGTAGCVHMSIQQILTQSDSPTTLSFPDHRQWQHFQSRITGAPRRTQAGPKYLSTHLAEIPSAVVCMLFSFFTGDG